MAVQTLVLLGPGGIGKSSLDRALHPDVHRIDPYRLRTGGPRPAEGENPPDVYYAHPRIRDELLDVYARLHVDGISLSESVQWFPAAATLFLKVRTDWQLLFLGSLPGRVSKAEIYAPALPVLLGHPDVWSRLGHVIMVILNPVAPLETLATLEALEAATATNCRLRGDDATTIAARVGSLAEEAEAWRSMLAQGAVEYDNWPYAEHTYTRDGYDSTLAAARAKLVEGCPELAVFFRSESELGLPC